MCILNDVLANTPFSIHKNIIKINKENASSLSLHYRKLFNYNDVEILGSVKHFHKKTFGIKKRIPYNQYQNRIQNLSYIYNILINITQ